MYIIIGTSLRDGIATAKTDLNLRQTQKDHFLSESGEIVRVISLAPSLRGSIGHKVFFTPDFHGMNKNYQDSFCDIIHGRHSIVDKII